MRPLGVGLVYWAALDSLFEAGGPDLGVLELEPQTLWEKVCDHGVWQYRTNEALLERVAELQQAKLLHGVGHPVGGTVADPIDPVPELRRAVQRLNPAWVSEHLSFNRTLRRQDVEHAGFLLPPSQSPAAVRVAATNIDCLRRALGRPVAFVLGRELFATRRVTIDFAGSTLTIDYPDRPPPVGATPLSLTPHGALFTVPIRIGDLPPVAADLDLGNGGALLMSDPYAHRSREIGALRHATGEGGGVGGLREIDRVTLPKVSIGPYAIEHVPAEINRGAVVPLDGVNLGIQLLRNFVVTLDLGHCRLWLAPAATPVPPPKERAGLRLEQDGGALRVAYLAPTGPAKAAGLERDDRIVAIDGRPVDASYYPAGRFRWSNGPPGEAHRLRLTSGAERVVVLADYF